MWLLSCFLILLCGTVVSPFKIVIVHIGGVDGQVPPDEFNKKEWGGMARVKTALDNIDGYFGGKTLKIGHGKIYGVQPFDRHFRNNATLPDPVLTLFKAFGFKSTCLGRQDLYRNMKLLSESYTELGLPSVATNTEVISVGACDYCDTLKKQLKKYIILHALDLDGNNRKIALMSVSYDQVCKRTTCTIGDNKVEFTDPVTALINTLAELNAAEGKVDLVIANMLDFSLSQIKDIIPRVTGIGLFLSGDNLHLIPDYAGGEYNLPALVRGRYPILVNDRDAHVTVIASVAGHSSFVGSIKLEVKDGYADDIDIEGNVTNLCPEPECVQPDPAVKALVTVWEQQVKEASDKVIAELKHDLYFETPFCRFNECDGPLFIVDAMYFGSGADCAILNVGSIRGDFPAGSITQRQIDKALPFGGGVDIVTLSGQVLSKIVQLGISKIPAHENQQKDIRFTGSFLVYAGLKFEFTPEEEISEIENNKVKNLQIRNGDVYESISSSKRYRVVMPQFIKNGGDGYDLIPKSIKSSVSLDLITNLVKRHLLENNTIPEKGRMSIVEKEEVFRCEFHCTHGDCVRVSSTSEETVCQCHEDYEGDDCSIKDDTNLGLIIGVVLGVLFAVVFLSVIGIFKWRKAAEKRSRRRRVLLDNEDITDVEELKDSFSATALYKNDRVKVNYLQPESLTQVDYTHLLDLISMNHKNIINFVGVIPDPCCMVVEHGSVGKLSDALREEKLPKDTDLVCAIARDALNGVLYLHSNNIGHGMLTPACMILTSDFVCKISNFHLHGYTLEPEPMDLVLWLAPEVLNQIMPGMMEEEFVNRILADIFLAGNINTFEADHYGFGICLVALITYNPCPWGEDVHTSPGLSMMRESLRICIITEGKRPPETSNEQTKWELGGREFRLYEISRMCMSGSPSERPALTSLRPTLDEMTPDVSKMIASMTEKYTARLEEVVANRTTQLVTEKADAEYVLSSVGKLLSRIIPDDVLRRMKADGECISDSYEQGSACVIQVLKFRSMVKDDPMTAISVLNEVYQQIDEAATESNVTYTVADAGKYIAAHVEGSRESNTEVIVQFASMAVSRVDVHLPDDSSINVVAGVTCGESLHSAVVGVKALRYTLFGPAIKSCRSLVDSADVATNRVHVNKAVVNTLSKSSTISFTPHGSVFLAVVSEEPVSSRRSPKKDSSVVGLSVLSGRDKLLAVRSLLAGGALSSVATSMASSVGSPRDSSRKQSVASGGSLPQKRHQSVVSSTSNPIKSQKKLGARPPDREPLVEGQDDASIS